MASITAEELKRLTEKLQEANREQAGLSDTLAAAVESIDRSVSDGDLAAAEQEVSRLWAALQDHALVRTIVAGGSRAPSPEAPGSAGEAAIPRTEEAVVFVQELVWEIGNRARKGRTPDAGTP